VCRSYSHGGPADGAGRAPDPAGASLKGLPHRKVCRDLNLGLDLDAGFLFEGKGGPEQGCLHV